MSFMGFYTGIVLLLSSTVRGIFLSSTWRCWIYETTHPEPIVRLIEACYMFRHEEDLYQEEEAFRMLTEIIRTPDLLKAISGSSLKGVLDPQLDKLDLKAKEKMEHLHKLERRGFDVEKLKEAVMKDY